MALHNIFELAEDNDEFVEDNDEYKQLPRHLRDEDFSGVRDELVEDEDVLMLFDDGENGVSSDEEDANDDILHPSSMANMMLGSLGEKMHAANLHPEEWFRGFRSEHMRNHNIA